MVIGVMGLGIGTGGCATSSSLTPPPTAAQVSSAEAAVQRARQSGVEGSPGEHVRMAEQELAEARDLTSRGDNRGATLALARAEVDADLGQMLQRREKALADAEVVEGQLAEARKAPAAAGEAAGAAKSTTAAVPPAAPGGVPNTAAPGAVAPGPLPTEPVPGTTLPAAPANTGGTTKPTSASPGAKTPPLPGPPPKTAPVDPTRHSPADNPNPTTAPGPSGTGTGIPNGPGGIGNMTP
jgi:hypothetical protein